MNSKIYIICIDEDTALKAAKILSEIDDNLCIANTFITDSDYSDLCISDRYMYYISEDQLNLDYKNNALLYVVTDGDTQVSKGIAIDEFYNSQIIPVSLKAFNTINKHHFENEIIVWIDIKINKTKFSLVDYKLNLIESNYLLKILDSLKNNTPLYFGPDEDLKEGMKIVYDYFKGDKETKNSILNELF
ncbi:MAG: hypothetical protein J1F35_06370 [Erysipelotrichales bacterium]|nr:hypothetical protein [Erysipelotrichales bacterium]